MSSPALLRAADGTCYVAWEDYRNASYVAVYVQRFDGNGLPMWYDNGQRVTSSSAGEANPRLALESHGLLVVGFTSSQRNYVQQMSREGYRQWGSLAHALSYGSGGQTEANLVPDGRGGVIGCWSDERAVTENDLFMQRVDWWGRYGDPAPMVTAVTDVPQDQGGSVLLDWDRSYLDDYLYEGELGHYSIWRRYQGAKVQFPAGEVPHLAEALGMDETSVERILAAGWNYVADTGAQMQESYTYLAPTFADSTDGFVPVTEFKVLAHGDYQGFWESNVMGGYSVDSLAPGAPLMLNAVPGAGTDVKLDWISSGDYDEDLDVYRVYRSAAPGFTPGEASFISTSADSLYTDTSPPAGALYYLVTARDIHGNEGEPSNEATIGSATGVAPGVPRGFAVKYVTPNPFNLSTKIFFDLPATARPRVELFNTRGQRVRVLETGELPAGRHGIVWDGRDANGREVPSGVYLAQVSAGGQRGSVKLVLAK